MNLTTTYTATGNENYLILGTFTAQADIGYTLTGFGSNGLAYYYIDDVSITEQLTLPVELISFEATCQNDAVILEWQTVSEINNDFFTIEKSENGLDYYPIATINGNGNSTVKNNYRWTDNNSIGFTNTRIQNGYKNTEERTYYRLKQTDFDGKFDYFEPKSVDCNHLNPISIYPNPFQNNFTITLQQNMKFPVTIMVKDYLGRTTYREVITTKTQFYHVQLNQKFTTGTYFLNVFNESEQFIQKIIKLN